MKLVFFPGASLMELTMTASGLQVRCPGCEVVEVIRDTQRATDFHHSEGCAVHAQIVAAQKRYDQQHKPM